MDQKPHHRLQPEHRPFLPFSHFTTTKTNDRGAESVKQDGKVSQGKSTLLIQLGYKQTQ